MGNRGFFFTVFAVGALVACQAHAYDDEPDSFDLLGEFPTSEASSRIRPFQARASVIYGGLHLQSTRAATGADLTLDGVQAGVRVELEHWFHVGRDNRRSLGVLLDTQYLYVGRFNEAPGDPISYTSASIAAGYRVLGYGHTVPWSPELTLMLGPSYELFPSMASFRGFFGGYGYDLYHASSLGAKTAARLRFPLFSRYTAIEATGYYVHPLQIIGGTSGSSVDFSNTKSEGATVLLDFRPTKSMILGAGYYWGWFKLNYTAPSSPGPDTTIFFTKAFLASLRFNL